MMLKNSQAAKEVVCGSQSVGEEVQALFSVTVDLRKRKRERSSEKENDTELIPYVTDES